MKNRRQGVIVDNYDSFVFNIVRYVRELGVAPFVVRNDALIEQIEAINPSFLILSPGPGNPETAGISNELVLHFKSRIPILGVCLGHQCIAQVFGAKIERALRPFHGKTSLVSHDASNLLKHIPSPFRVTRYHSLIVKELSSSLKATAWSEEKEIMALSHREHPIFGVQFHPEALLSEYGHILLKNFFNI